MPRRSQQDRSQATKAELIRAGRELFASHGYANVSAEQIVAAAGLTRGALYHHFGDKRGLFVAVIEDVEQENTHEITEAIGAADDQWTSIVLGIGRFLDICQRPDVIQLAMIDAPAVLGWQGWRELEARHGLGMVTEALQGALDSGVLRPAPIPVLAKLVLSSITEAGMIIAHAVDPTTARAQAEQALLLMMTGLLHSDPAAAGSP
jgi:AcrR family transcriptional regulator